MQRPEMEVRVDDPINTLLRAARARLLKMHYESNSGHIGGNLSCIDALMLLHHFVMQPDDRFIL